MRPVSCIVLREFDFLFCEQEEPEVLNVAYRQEAYSTTKRCGGNV